MCTPSQQQLVGAHSWVGLSLVDQVWISGRSIQALGTFTAAVMGVCTQVYGSSGQLGAAQQ